MKVGVPQVPRSRASPPFRQQALGRRTLTSRTLNCCMRPHRWLLGVAHCLADLQRLLPVATNPRTHGLGHLVVVRARTGWCQHRPVTGVLLTLPATAVAVGAPIQPTSNLVMVRSNDCSCLARRVTVDPLLSYARSSSMTTRCRKPKFEAGGSGQHRSGCCRLPPALGLTVSNILQSFGLALACATTGDRVPARGMRPRAREV